MSILSLLPRSFRTRDAARDMQTDANRFGAVRAALEEAAASARRERAGLQRRLELYHAQASSLIDVTGDYGARDSEDEAAITSAEASAERARVRLATIDEQIGRFTQLLDQLEAPPASARAASA